MTTIISFVSQKGGVGKTTSAINLATAFAFGGYSVLLVDLDPQSSIRFSMGINTKISIGTRELFLDPSIPIKELVRKTDHENLDFIFSNIDTIKNEESVFKIGDNSRYLMERINEDKGEYDFIIVDAPSSTNNMTINAIYCSDLIILPLQCESLAIKSLKRFLVAFNELQTRLTDKRLRLAGILLTMYDSDIEVHRKVSQQIYRALSDAVFNTIIPRNEAIIEASALGKSVVTHKLNSIGATAYIRLMNELVDKFSLR
jgi:chromosome partitioning protein